MLTLTNRIDMRPGAVPLVIHLGQYDSDFSLVFELYSSAGDFTVESGTTAMIRGTKTDGHAYDADATIDISAKTVTVAGSEQMTAAKGRNVYELVLKKGTKVLSTANFILDVERAAMDADTIASESVLKELNAIIAGAETATEAAADAASAADRAEDAAESVSSASAQIATNTADIADLKADFEQLEPGLSAEAKAALLACFAKVAWIDEHGQDYYDALEEALNSDTPTPPPVFDYGVYVPESVINGKYIDSDGVVKNGEANSSWYIEDYIDVYASSYWIGMTPSIAYIGPPPYSGTNWRISEYDSEKRFIKQTQYAINYEGPYASATFLFDTNTRYIRLGWYDTVTQSEHRFDIEDPATFTPLQMELGDIDSTTGQNMESVARIRSNGYIPVDGTITISSCPFGDTWTSWCNLWPNKPGYIIRCFDANKEFVGTLSVDGEPYLQRELQDVALPTGTKFIRFMHQIPDGSNANWIYFVNRPFYINGTKYLLTE